MSKKNGKQGMVKKGTLPRIIKTLFEFYPVMMPVVLICIVFSILYLVSNCVRGLQSDDGCNYTRLIKEDA